MSIAAVPTQPAVEIAVSRQNVLLPIESAALLQCGHCSLAEAARFLAPRFLIPMVHPEAGWPV